MNEEELQKKLREAFAEEAQERVEAISSGIVNLEKITLPEDRQPIMEDIYREFHSLKGAARAVNISSLETLCQAVESVLSRMRSGEEAPGDPFFDTLYKVLDYLDKALHQDGDTDNEIDDLLSSIEALNHGEQKQAAPPVPAEGQEKGSKFSFQDDTRPQGEKVAPEMVAKPPAKTEKGLAPSQPPAHQITLGDTVRVASQKLDATLLIAEEFVSMKLISRQHLENFRALFQDLLAWERQWARIEEDMRRLRKNTGDDSLISDLIAFLDWNREQVTALKKQLKSMVKATEEDHSSCGALVDDLLDKMKEISMQPCATLLETLPRMVKSLARDLGKEIDFTLQGQELEIDRRILEGMKDPLVHLLRNAVDHGIGSPEDRLEQGKEASGHIKLMVSRTEDQKLELLLADDGKGIPTDLLKQKAVENGIITSDEAEAMDHKEALSLIFRTGLSLSPMVTKLSGRGLGMDIVQKKVQELGGMIDVESSPEKGTSFRIKLPVTMATFRGILVKVSDNLFVLPSSHVERVLLVTEEDIKTIENRPTISVDERVICLVDLARIMNLPSTGKDNNPGDAVMVILGFGEGRIAVRVDEVLKEQEVLVKGLGKQLVRVPYLSGATILGSGQLVPVLNVADLFRNPSERQEESSAEAGKPRPNGEKSILVVDDSITSRMLLKNILEVAGYRVKTVVDGREAYATLKTDSFDLIVSDVEMPRMNGFELTSAIRSDEEMKEMPVVLVTSLDSREDRERGIDVGANAYIVKSRFDQDDLLEVIKRFV